MKQNWENNFTEHNKRGMKTVKFLLKYSNKRCQKEENKIRTDGYDNCIGG